ncbi:MAG: preprotein translocase subunit YajC, partial [Magnetococcales bacterium]|nr:preprotein translocase subunit YajC [Magnetococcales bacterium]
MLDIVSSAYAQNQAAPPDATLPNIIFMVLLFAIFYFLLIRPQQKQAKEHREMVDNLQRGDSVITGGGVIGKIHRVEEDVAVVEIGEVEVAKRSFKPVRI